jgi:5'-methylthioadenosine phosphorylase
MAILGVIGGSGIYDLEVLTDRQTIDVSTPFGQPSSLVVSGLVGPTRLLFLARHGPGHVFSPSDVPYRANVFALKQAGATHLLSLSAVGSLREALPPRDLVIPDQIIDRTLGRQRTFFDRGVVAHVGIADPFCREFSDTLQSAAGDVGIAVVRGGAYVCIEGPQFSTRAESELYRSWNAAIIGMTAMPEARLAREAELCYAMLAMVTDYDVWHENEADVSVAVVLSNLHANSRAASKIIQSLAARGLPARSCSCGSALRHAIVTDPASIGSASRDRLGLLLERHLGHEG